MTEYNEMMKDIVKKRLQAMPPNVSFSVGDFGDFTRDELLQQIDEDTEVGKAAVEMQINFIKKMPRLLVQ